MDDARIDAICSKLKNQRARSELAAFLHTVEELGVDDDPAPVTETETEYNDGVATMLLADLEEIQKQKINVIKREARFAFPKNMQTPVLVGAGEIDINAKGQYGFTRLHSAVMEHDIDEVQSLLMQGANKNIRDNSGLTPFERAQRRGYEDLMQILE